MKTLRLIAFLGLVSIIVSCGGGGTGDTSNSDPEDPGDGDDENIVDLAELDGVDSIAIDSAFLYTFEKAVDTTTVNETTLFLVKVTTVNENLALKDEPVAAAGETCNPFEAVAGTTTCAEDGTTCSIAPTAPLTPDAEYAVCITSGVTYEDGTSAEDDSIPLPPTEEWVLECRSSPECPPQLPTCDTGEERCVRANDQKIHAAAITAVPNYIFLRWNPPSEAGGPNDDGVYIRRAVGETCPDTESGDLVYEGTDQTFADTSVEEGETYCYKMWWRSVLEGGGHIAPYASNLATLPLESTLYTDGGPASLLWHNQSTGAVAEWRIGNDGTQKSYGAVYDNNISPTHWQIVGQIDLDGVEEPLIETQTDLVKDIVWQNASTRALYYWLMNMDGTVKSTGQITNNGSPIHLGSQWQVVGFVNLNPGIDPGQDNYGDIVFLNTSTRYLYYWFLEGGDDGIHILRTCDENGQNPGCTDCANSCTGKIKDDTLSSAWTVVAVGDLLNSKMDPNPEILFSNSSTRALALWELDNKGRYLSSVTVKDSVGSTYRLDAVEDILYDVYGNIELLWKNTNTNKYYLWFLDTTGAYLSSQQILDSSDESEVTVSSSWDLDGAVKINYDGIAKDLIFRRNTGTYGLAGWRLDGSTGARDEVYTITSSLSNNWQIFSMTDE